MAISYKKIVSKIMKSTLKERGFHSVSTSKGHALLFSCLYERKVEEKPQIIEIYESTFDQFTIYMRYTGGKIQKGQYKDETSFIVCVEKFLDILEKRGFDEMDLFSEQVVVLKSIHKKEFLDEYAQLKESFLDKHRSSDDYSISKALKLMDSVIWNVRSQEYTDAIITLKEVAAYYTYILLRLDGMQIEEVNNRDELSLIRRSDDTRRPVILWPLTDVFRIWDANRKGYDYHMGMYIRNILTINEFRYDDELNRYISEIQ